MEIKIAVCDDESRQAEYTKMLVNKWSELMSVKVHKAQQRGWSVHD